MAFNRQNGLVYVPVQESSGVFLSDPKFTPKPLGVNVGIVSDPARLPLTPEVIGALKGPSISYLLAWDPKAQQEVWRSPTPGPINGGALTTAGDLVFQGTVDGNMVAYEAKTGLKLWSFECGSAILAAPITYTVGGSQFLSVVVGWGGIYSMLGGQAAWDHGSLASITAAY